MRLFLTVLFGITFALNLRAKIPENMVLIAKGEILPFFDRSKDGKKQKETISSFYLDKFQVTNSDYLKFVKENPNWRKSQVVRIFADKSYLNHWSGDFSFDPKTKDAPVRYVSWFAASNYCRSLGKELPSIAQWEYVGAADEKSKNAIDSDKFKERILKWYSKPTTDNFPNVQTTYKDAWGVHGMHGVIWEWTLDFNNSLVTGESREDSTINKDKFCGSGVLGAKDSRDYAAFMRYGFRSSLRGDYTVANLGFRCAKQIEGVYDVPKK